MNRTLKKRELIGKAKELRRLFFAQNQVSGETVAIRYAKAERRRVAFITKGIKKAVERNRIRRRLKEVYRLNKHRFSESHEYLFIAQPKTLSKDFSALEAEVLELAQRLVDA